MGSGDFKFLYNHIFANDPKTTNRFDNYNTPYDYNAMRKVLDGIYNRQQAGIGRNVGAGLQDTRQSTAARMASQGITGGSVLNSAIRGGEDQVLDKGFDAYNALDIARLSQQPALMQMENANKFQTTQAAQNVDQQNIANMIQRYGLLNNVVGGMSTAEYNEDNAPGFLEDLFSGLGQIGSILSIPTKFGASGATSNLLSSILKN